ncbi:hypothetical protein VCRA2133E348_920009 [Vibrio crassostreae]|nr:hypothetical protein VCRA2133E348_920009 [Vibrio crassostreae]CAK3694215.1 hypothetical protein VCRA213O314_950003 [Vibrio crassostreae]
MKRARPVREKLDERKVIEFIIADVAPPMYQTPSVAPGDIR